MKNKKLIISILFLILIGSIGYHQIQQKAKASYPKLAQEFPQTKVALGGIGALGKIEPRSRVIAVADDSGPEGARVKELLVNEGQIVRKGQTLAVLSDFNRRQLKMEGALAKAKALESKILAESANADYLFAEFKRMEQLLQKQAIARSRFDEAAKNYYQTRAMVQSLHAELESVRADSSLSRQELQQGTIDSPIDGTVVSIFSRPGERVSSKGLAEIADISQLEVVAEIYERDMPRVKLGQKASIQVPGIAEPISGEVNQIGFLVRKNDLNSTDPLSDKDTRTVPVRIALEPKMKDVLQHLIYMQVAVKLL
jgi:HlyD family secretion protein